MIYYTITCIVLHNTILVFSLFLLKQYTFIFANTLDKHILNNSTHFSLFIQKCSLKSLRRKKQRPGICFLRLKRHITSHAEQCYLVKIVSVVSRALVADKPFKLKVLGGSVALLSPPGRWRRGHFVHERR